MSYPRRDALPMDPRVPQARAQERNIECGVLLEDPSFATHLARQWLGLIDAKLVVEFADWTAPR